MEESLRAISIAGPMRLGACSAQAESLQVIGQAGYLSEWEVSGSVARASLAGALRARPFVREHERPSQIVDARSHFFFGGGFGPSIGGSDFT